MQLKLSPDIFAREQMSGHRSDSETRALTRRTRRKLRPNALNVWSPERVLPEAGRRAIVEGTPAVDDERVDVEPANPGLAPVIGDSPESRAVRRVGTNVSALAAQASATSAEAPARKRGREK